jgi:hypothetical protein
MSSNIQPNSDDDLHSKQPLVPIKNIPYFKIDYNYVPTFEIIQVSKSKLQSIKKEAKKKMFEDNAEDSDFHKSRISRGLISS